MTKVSKILIALILVTGCTGRGNRPQDLEEDNQSVFAVNVIPAAQGEIKDYLELNGDVVAKSSVDVYPDVAGKVMRVYVELGSEVRKGQVLAEVDPSRPGATFAASPVKASISGTVVSNPLPVGSTVVPSVPLVRLSQMNELEVKTEIAERFVSKMREGLNVVMRFEAFPGEIFLGRVKELSPVMDPVSRTLGLTIGFNQKDPGVRAGMFAQIKVITQEKRGIVKLPAQCVVNRFGEDFVFVVQEDKSVAKRSVVKGIQIDNKVEIISGLTAGELVVVRGQSLLEDRSMVRIIEELEALTAEEKIN